MSSRNVPSSSDPDIDMEMELAIEFSKKTFLEEEKRRNSEQAENDLIVIEDPNVIQRRDTIKRIQNLFDNNTPNVVYRTSQPSPSNNYLPQLRPPAISTSHSFNGPFHLQHQHQKQQHEITFSPPPPQSATLQRLIQNGQPSSISLNTPAVAQSEQQRRLGFLQMGPATSNSFANSVPSTPLSYDFQGPNLMKQNQGNKIRSNSMAHETIIDLDDFDPLLQTINSQINLDVDQEDNKDTKEEDSNPMQEESPKIDNPLSTSLVYDKNVTNYALLDKTLQIIQQSGSNYDAEAKKLADYTSTLKADSNSLFFAPNVNYCTTKAESIKLIVVEDKTWPHDHAEFPRKITFTCHIDKLCSDILIEVLSELLPPELINNDELPLKEYGLRVWGYDEFLDDECTLGSFLFVGNLIEFGQDVKLEVGKRQLNTNQTAISFTRPEFPKSMLLNAQNFEGYVQTILGYVNHLAKEQDYTIWSQVLELIKLLKSSMNQTLLQEINNAIDAINSATSKKAYEISISNFASAIVRQLFAYSRSSYSNFSVHTDALQLPGLREETMSIEEASGNFKFSIESLNNLSKHWTAQYYQFYVQIEIIHGKFCYRQLTTPHKGLKASNHDFILFEEPFELQKLLSALPRNTSLSFIVFGVPFAVMPSGKRRMSQSEDVQLASGVLPLFNHDGIMLQGPIMLALTEIHNNRILPWGPQKLIYQPGDPVIVLQFPEYEHNIIFPSEIQIPQIATFEYERLNEEDRSCIEWIIHHRHIHLFELDDDYKKLLWSKRAYLTKKPLALPLVLVSAFAWDFVSVSNIYVLLDVWAELEPEDALELLLPCFVDSRIRAKAVEWIGKGTTAQLLNFIPQLLEALRYEQYEDSAISKFLLLEATKNRSFAFELYWQLNQRLVVTDDLRFKLRYKLLQDELLKLDIPGFLNDLSYQHVFLDKLDDVYKKAHNYNDLNAMNDTLRKGLYGMVEYFKIRNLRLPLCPSFPCKELVVDRATHFNSAAKPVALHFTSENSTYPVIYKVGDDLRQDAVVMQLVNLINDIWNREGLDMRIVTFKCLPTGRNKGLVEMVRDCQTLREIQVVSGLQGVIDVKVLNNWLQSNNPSEFLYKQAAENFRKSCAGWSVVSYVLGLADRHNDNLMVCKTGQLFHIDFGKYLGDVQMAGSIKRDRVPFVITTEIVNVINQGGLETTEFFQKFVDEMCSAFQCLRRRATVLVNTMRLMTAGNIPGLNESAVSFVEEKLMLSETDDEAGLLLTTKIVESVQSVYPKINFIVHTIAQGKGNLWELLFGNNLTDFDHMPFNLETCTKETDGEIVSVYVQRFRKIKDSKDGTKVYLYDCKVKRKNMAEDPLISRSYDDFQTFYLLLCRKFPNIGIPNLGRSRFLVRSNVAPVANERFIELQHFLQMLFVLPPEISHSNLVYNFFHHTRQDTEMSANEEMQEEASSQMARAELDLRLILNPNQSTFRIIVGHARRVQLIGNNETYVKVYLRTRDGAVVGGGKKKTDVVRGINPTYNKELCYQLTPIEMAEIFTYVLHVSIWQRTGSIMKDSFALCETVIVLSSLHECQPNTDRVIEKKGNYQMFYK